MRHNARQSDNNRKLSLKWPWDVIQYFIKKTKECTHTHISTKIQKRKYLEEFDAANEKEQIF